MNVSRYSYEEELPRPHVHAHCSATCVVPPSRPPPLYLCTRTSSFRRPSSQSLRALITIESDPPRFSHSSAAALSAGGTGRVDGKLFTDRNAGMHLPASYCDYGVQPHDHTLSTGCLQLHVGAATLSRRGRVLSYKILARWLQCASRILCSARTPVRARSCRRGHHD